MSTSSSFKHEIINENIDDDDDDDWETVVNPSNVVVAAEAAATSTALSRPYSTPPPPQQFGSTTTSSSSMETTYVSIHPTDLSMPSSLPTAAAAAATVVEVSKHRKQQLTGISIPMIVPPPMQLSSRLPQQHQQHSLYHNDNTESNRNSFVNHDCLQIMSTLATAQVQQPPMTVSSTHHQQQHGMAKTTTSTIILSTTIPTFMPQTTTRVKRNNNQSKEQQQQQRRRGGGGGDLGDEDKANKEEEDVESRKLVSAHSCEPPPPPSSLYLEEHQDQGPNSLQQPPPCSRYDDSDDGKCNEDGVWDAGIVASNPVMTGTNTENDEDDDDQHDNELDKNNIHNRMMTTASAAPSHNHNNNNNRLLRTIMVSAANILVWYNFAIFGFFSDVLGAVFFVQEDGNHPPNMNSTSTSSSSSSSSSSSKSLMESFAVFGLAFLMRPIGGLLFGYIGDTRSRKRALEISIFLMAVATLALGCLPTPAMIGDASSWSSAMIVPMLIATRMLQGLSVGGHLMSSLVYTCEQCPPGQWGWYGSFVVAEANFGTLVAGLSGVTLQSLRSDEEILDGAWRIPFLVGIVVIIPGCYLCWCCHDDEDDNEEEQDQLQEQRHERQEQNNIVDGTRGKGLRIVNEKEHANNNHKTKKKKIRINPLREAFRRENWRSLLAAAMVPMLWSAGFYLSFVWMATYMKDLVHPPVQDAFEINSISLFLSVCVGFPIAGRLSDWYGRKRIMTIGGAGMGLLGPILVISIAKNSHPVLAFVSQSMIGISLSCWGGPMCAWLVESFEPAARLTSVATGYNLAQAVIGGFTPLLATIMVRRLGVDSPGFILSALATISLTGLWVVAPQTRRIRTSTHGNHPWSMSSSSSLSVSSSSSPSFQNVPMDEPSPTKSSSSTTDWEGNPSFSDLEEDVSKEFNSSNIINNNNNNNNTLNEDYLKDKELA